MQCHETLCELRFSPVNRRVVGGQDANRRSLEWLFRKMLTDVAAAARSKFRSTIRSTKSEVLYDFGGFRRSPRVCKSLKNLKRQNCHSRAHGSESGVVAPKSRWSSGWCGLCPFLCPRSFKIVHNPARLDSNPRY